MKFYLDGKKITKAEAMTYITTNQLKEARADFIKDPLQEISWYIGKGVLIVKF